MKVLIIEDELPSFEHLQHCLKDLLSEVFIYPPITSVRHAINFMAQVPEIDLLFADVHLEDGHSFEALTHFPRHLPVVYVTSYDQYWMQSLEHDGIDYLLKPVRKEKLAATIAKYERLKIFFSNPGQLSNPNQNTHAIKDRIVVRKGYEFQLLPLAHIVCFYTESKIVFAIDHHGHKYLCEEPNLTDIYCRLNTVHFFRANRQYIIHARHVERFHMDDKGRVIVQLANLSNHHIKISQENAFAFRKWAGLKPS